MVKFKLWDGKFLQMLEKSEWGGVEERPYEELEATELPTSFVRFCYDDLYTKYNTAVTVDALKECQKDHMQNQGWEDIRYNFAVNPEGMIYECRGWFTEPAPPDKYHPLRYKIMDICFIGDFKEKDPPWPMMNSALHIVMKGLASLFINCNFKIIGLREPDEGPLNFPY